VVELPVPDLLDPVAITDDPATGNGPGAPVDPRPARGGSPADVPGVAGAPSQAVPAASTPAPPTADRGAAPDPVAVVIPEPDALAPASWRWPSPTSAGSPGAAPVGLTTPFLSTAPPAMSVPSTLPGDGGATAGRGGGARHAPPAVRSQPEPWSPAAPGSPFSAGAASPAGAPGGLGGWALASLLFVLLALAAPRRALLRPAPSPVLSLRPAYTPARAPPGS
jgi:hypothetical protein